MAFWFRTLCSELPQNAMKPKMTSTKSPSLNVRLGKNRGLRFMGRFVRERRFPSSSRRSTLRRGGVVET